MAEKLTAEKSIEERVAAPVQQVWDLLSDFSAITRRTAGIQDFRIEGEGAGAVRSFRVGDGPILRERIEHWDPANHCFAYALLPPAFMDDHYSEIRMRADGPGACVIHWMGRCSVASAEEVEPAASFSKTSSATVSAGCAGNWASHSRRAARRTGAARANS